MTSIATTGNTAEITTPASISKAVGQTPSGNDPASFIEMLGTANPLERLVDPTMTAPLPSLRRIELTIDELSDLQTLDVSGERCEGAPLTQTTSIESPPVVAMEIAVQAAYLASVAPGNPDEPAAGQPAIATSMQSGANEAPSRTRLGLNAAKFIGIHEIGWGRSLPAQSNLVRVDMPVDAQQGMNSIFSGRHSAGPTGSLPTMIRQETHLVAAKSPTHALQQFVLDQAKPESDGSSRESSGTSIAEITARHPQSAPTIGEIEPVTDQIAGQVAGTLASLRGAASINSSEAAPQALAVGQPAEPAPDVVKTLRFDLKPADLGEVQVRLSWRGNELRLHLSFSSERAAGIAQSEGQSLKQVLSDAGASVGQIVIDAIATPRIDLQPRLDAPATQSQNAGGTTTSWSGANRERHSQQESSQRQPLRDPTSEEPVGPSSDRSGLFI